MLEIENQIIYTIILLVLLLVKHFLADFPLQTDYMLKKSAKEGWILPLALHSSVHSLLTFAVLIFFINPVTAIICAIAEFFIHFIMDMVKARPNLLGRYNITEPQFWWSLGLDQLVHQLTYVGMILFILNQ